MAVRKISSVEEFKGLMSEVISTSVDNFVLDFSKSSSSLTTSPLGVLLAEWSRRGWKNKLKLTTARLFSPKSTSTSSTTSLWSKKCSACQHLNSSKEEHRLPESKVLTRTQSPPRSTSSPRYEFLLFLLSIFQSLVNFWKKDERNCFDFTTIYWIKQHF